MKKAISITASLCLLLSALSSCGNTTPPAGDSQQSQNDTPADSGNTGKIIVAEITTDMNDTETAVNNFNISHEIQADYRKYSENDDFYGDSAFERLNSEIQSGSVPDVIIASPEKIKKLNEEAVLTDLSPLLDSGEGLKRADVLENVVSSLDSDGKIPAVYNGFILQTAAVRSDRYDSSFENWSVEQVLDAYNNLPYKGDLLYEQYSATDVQGYMLKKAPLDCIDYKNRKCDFSKMLDIFSFLKTTDFQNRTELMASMSSEESSQFLKDMQMKLMDYQALVGRIWIKGINDWYAVDYSRFGGSDITFVGYPSFSGNGAYTQVDRMFAISENCSDKAAAWEFVSQFFEDGTEIEMSTKKNMLPVTKKSIDDLAYNAANIGTGSILSPCTLPDGSGYTISPEAVDQLVEYIKTVKIEPWTDTELENIISECCDEMLTSKKTINQVIETLNYRVSEHLFPETITTEEEN